MEVWDPQDKPTVFSQIKRAIITRYQVFKEWARALLPGLFR